MNIIPILYKNNLKIHASLILTNHICDSFTLVPINPRLKSTPQVYMYGINLKMKRPSISSECC